MTRDAKGIVVKIGQSLIPNSGGRIMANTQNATEVASKTNPSRKITFLFIG
jgi:hypothetical protein